MPSIILVRGGGDLATGVVIRLVKSGLRVAITELAQPLAVRRSVAFSEAIYFGEMTVENITAQRVHDPGDTLSILSIFGKQHVPILVDPDCISAKSLRPCVIIDGRMTKHPPEPIGYIPQLYVGLGPGFEAGVNCQAVIETRRGHSLGRVYFKGGPISDTGVPDGNPARVLRAPADGTVIAHRKIGEQVQVGEIIGEIKPNHQDGLHSIQSPLDGLLRGFIHPGIQVTKGMKIGDIDPRNDPSTCTLVSDKALAIGGGVLEAMLSKTEIRNQLWA